MITPYVKNKYEEAMKNHPDKSSDIHGSWTLMLTEIDAGESRDHEENLFLNHLEEIISGKTENS